MKLKFKHWGFLAFMLWGMGASLSAKVERTTVYIFGFSAAFTDSVAYITDIQQLDSAYIDTKTGFLMDRSVYSGQLQTYLESMKTMSDCTCAVFFNTKKSKLEDEYKKIRKRYEGDDNVVLKEAGSDVFKFQSVAYIAPAVAEPVQPKAAGKPKRSKKPASGQPVKSN